MTIANWSGAPNASTVYKNSGILRYQFGTNNAAVQNVTLQGQQGYVIRCLGPAASVNPDMDNQAFGMTVGGAAFNSNGNLNSIFTGISTIQWNEESQGAGAGVRYPPNAPNAGAATGQARLQANGRIPAGTKVMAWFQSSTSMHASSGNDQQYEPWVQTEVITSVPYIGGAAQTGQPQYITSIRVGVFNNATASGAIQMSGIVFVWLMHSLIDLPGTLADQSIQPGSGGI